MVYGETITRQRATGTTDRYSGQETNLSWTAPDELDIDGVAVEPVSSFEVIEVGRERIEIDLRLYLPYGADVKANDRVVVRGNTYDVKGDRGDWHNPFTGAEPGSTVVCKRVKG